MRVFGKLSVALIIAGSVTSPAWAGQSMPATPGPLVGAGLPALIGLGYLYKRIRKSRGE